MLTNVRVVAFTVSELFKKNQKGGVITHAQPGLNE